MKKMTAMFLVLVMCLTLTATASAKKPVDGGQMSGGSSVNIPNYVPRAQGGGGAAQPVDIVNTVVVVAKFVRDVVGTATAVTTVYKAAQAAYQFVTQE